MYPQIIEKAVLVHHGKTYHSSSPMKPKSRDFAEPWVRLVNIGWQTGLFK
jgi:hypothetical protein